MSPLFIFDSKYLISRKAVAPPACRGVFCFPTHAARHEKPGTTPQPQPGLAFSEKAKLASSAKAEHTFVDLDSKRPMIVVVEKT